MTEKGSAAGSGGNGMPSVSHTADDRLTGPDASLARAASRCAARGIPLRLRMAMQLWDGDQYSAWRGQIWKVDVAGATEARQVQQALERFYDALALEGAERVMEMLTVAGTSQGGIPVPEHEEQIDGGPEQTSTPDPS